MDTSRGSGGRSGVVAGSVWERRMRVDEVKGGIKVFGIIDGHDDADEPTVPPSSSLTPKRAEVVVGKRRTWKSEATKEGPIQIAWEEVNESKSKDLDDEQVKKKKSPVQSKKERGELGAKDPSESLLGGGGGGGGADKSSAELRKKILVSSRVKTERSSVSAQLCGSEEICKEVGVCQERIITSTVSHNVGHHDPNSDDDDDDEFFDDEGSKVEGFDEGAEIGVEKQRFDVKKVQVTEQKPKTVTSGEKKNSSNNYRNISFDGVKRPSLLNSGEVYRDTAYSPSSKPTSLHTAKEPPPATKHVTVDPNYAKQSSLSGYSLLSEEAQKKWYNLVDLLMWRNAYKSALVFAMGTLMIISSPYIKYLGISFISLVSYLGLICLAAIFLYRSFTSSIPAVKYSFGEEEAMRLVKLVLPYFDELLFKLGAVLSGDPIATMKLAVLLFVLARCGSYVTVGMVVKLGFFGAFTVPKLCSVYYNEITVQGKFWSQRFRDAWDSCSHKKAISAASFLVFWNFCSTVARVWAAFMAYVAFRYHEQTSARDSLTQDHGGAEFNASAHVGGKMQRQRPTMAEQTKEKKLF